jgi:tetratricopeptide (TPR) repeat protein
MAELRQLHKGSADRPAVVFVHGLGGHPIDTWRHPTSLADDCWPHWVGRDTDCDVWVMGYDASLSAWQAQAMPLLDQGDQVADLLAHKPGLEGRRLILIGHSLGGLVIKAMLVSVRTKGDATVAPLAERLCGVVFIATPHTGSELATLARAVRIALRTNEQVGDMAIHDAALRTLNQQFKAAVQPLGLHVKVFAETHGVPIRLRIWNWWIPTLWRVVVVDPTSSDLGLPGVTAVRMAADHFNICKPERADQQIHDSLTQFVRTVANARAAQPVAVAATEVAQALRAFDVTSLRVVRQTGQLAGPADNRLQPREGRFYGRESEIEQVLAFLRGGADAAVVTAKEVAGVAGIGKTEVCKAALKAWLGERPGTIAYYVDVPDRAGAPALIERLAAAVGAEGVSTLAELLTLLPDALYYLDNLESVAEQDEGREVLKALRDCTGIRLLVSSRVSLPALLGKPIVLDVLPGDAALRLFRELWAGHDALPQAGELERFVSGQLGNHALSVTLAARLGDCYAYPELVERWRSEGAAVATDPQDRGRLGSLILSLRLTAEALSKHHGALSVWAMAALFVDGIADGVLAQLEGAAGWGAARPWLVRHHILVRQADRWHMLPPLARYALDASIRSEDGFDWGACGEPVRRLFAAAARRASPIASTDDSLSARAWLLAEFGTLGRLLLHEIATTAPDRRFLQQVHDDLINQYQFHVAVSRGLLHALAQQIERPASALNALGDLESRLGRVDEARGLYDRALALFEREQDGLGQANTFSALGDLESRLGRVDEARGLYDRALALFEREQSGLGQANTFSALGDLESRLGRVDEARGLYDKALALFEREQSGLGQANTLRALGDLERRIGRVDEARGLYDRALALFEREQAGLGQANTLRALGNLESRLGRVDEARGLYERALALFEREQAGLGQANTLKAQGDLEERLGRLEEARGLYDRALALFERGKDGLGQANTLRALGELERRLGRLDEARGLYDKALALFEREQDGLGQANTLRALGDLESRLGGVDEARGLYDRALALFEREQDGLGQANTFSALGNLESRLGRLDEARRLYDKALALFERERDGSGQANTLKALGDLESRLGGDDEARGLYDRALALFEHEQSGLGQANTLRALGDLERRLSRADEARGLYDKALALFEREQDGLGQANTLLGLGRLLCQASKWDSATETLQRALRLYGDEREPVGAAYTFAEVARCRHALNDVTRRDEAMAKALEAADRGGIPNVVSYVRDVLTEIAGSPERAQCWIDGRGLPS